MGNVKAKTMSERFGFVDDDLKTPEHDAIVCWFEENALEALSKHLPSPQWTEEQLRIAREVRAHLRLSAEPPSRTPPRIVQCTWEPVIKNARGFEIGFIDLLITVEIHIPDRWWDDRPTYAGAEPRRRAEEAHHRRLSFWIEVKPRIQSLGELFRQLSLYRENLDRNDRIIVCCPDDTHARRIESQGYGFVKAEL